MSFQQMELDFKTQLNLLKLKTQNHSASFKKGNIAILRNPSNLLRVIKKVNKERNASSNYDNNFPYLNYSHNDLLKMSKEAQLEIQKTLPEKQENFKQYQKQLNDKIGKLNGKQVIKEILNMEQERNFTEDLKRTKFKTMIQGFAHHNRQINSEMSFCRQKLMEEDDYKNGKEAYNKISRMFVNSRNDNQEERYKFCKQVYAYSIQKNKLLQNQHQSINDHFKSSFQRDDTHSQIITKLNHFERLVENLLNEFGGIIQDQQISNIIMGIKKIYQNQILSENNQSKISFVGASCQLLEELFYQNVQKKVKYEFLENAPLSIQYVYGYIKHFVFTQEFLECYPVQTDSQNVPIWAISFYALKCGLKNDLLKYLNQYTGDMLEIKKLASLIEGNKNQFSSNPLSSDGFFGHEENQTFKSLLSVMFGQKEDVTCFPEMKIWDLIWFNLKKICYESNAKEQEKKLLQFQIRLTQSKEFQEGDNVYSRYQKMQIYLYTLQIEEIIKMMLLKQQEVNIGMNLLFIGFETALIRDDLFSNKNYDIISKAYQNYILELASNEKEKALSYWTCLDSYELISVKIKQTLLSDKSLLDTIFTTSSNQVDHYQRFRLLLSSELRNMIMDKIIKETKFNVLLVESWYLVMLEESNEHYKLINHIIEFDAYIIENMYQGKFKSNYETNFSWPQKYLNELFKKRLDNSLWIKQPNYRECKISTAAKECFRYYMQCSNSYEVLKMWLKNEFFSFNPLEFSSNTKYIILQMLLLQLKLFISEINQDYNMITKINQKQNFKSTLIQLKQYYYDIFKEMSTQTWTQTDAEDLKRKIEQEFDSLDALLEDQLIINSLHKE